MATDTEPIKKLSEASSDDRQTALADMAGIVINGEPVEGYCWFRGFLWTEDSAGLPDEIWNPDRSRDLAVKLTMQWATCLTVHDSIVLDVDKMTKFIECLYEQCSSAEGIDLADVYGDNHRAIAFALLVSEPAKLIDALLVASGKFTI